MTEPGRPFCLCLAGPNGSGKSTLAKALRTQHALNSWIDPDIVAREMRDERAAFAAARNQRVDFAQQLLNFGFETVFSHRSNAEFLDALKTLGYEVHLYFVCTEHPTINIARVSNRVRLGGHDVPRNKIVERYSRALDNLVLSVGRFDRIVFYDNSSLADGRVVGEIINAPTPRVSLFPRPHVPAWTMRVLNRAYLVLVEETGLPQMLDENPWYRDDDARRKQLLDQFRI